jgi:hypothetical protein
MARGNLMKKCSPKSGATNWKKMGFSSHKACVKAGGKPRGSTRGAPRKARKARNGRRTTSFKRKIGGKKGQTIRISVSKPRAASKAGFVSRKSIASKKRTARKSLGKAMTQHRRRVNGIISRIK